MCLDARVSRCSDEPSCFFAVRSLEFADRLFHFFGNSEIDEIIFSFCVDHDVLGLDILMEDVGVVQHTKRLEEFCCKC